MLNSSNQNNIKITDKLFFDENDLSKTKIFNLVNDTLSSGDW